MTSIEISKGTRLVLKPWICVQLYHLFLLYFAKNKDIHVWLLQITKNRGLKQRRMASWTVKQSFLITLVTYMKNMVRNSENYYEIVLVICPKNYFIYFNSTGHICAASQNDLINEQNAYLFIWIIYMSKK